MARLKKLVNGSQCPTCLVGETHPNRPDIKVILVRVLEHDGSWWSQCLVCAGLWDRNLNYSPRTFDHRKGWFRC